MLRLRSLFILATIGLVLGAVAQFGGVSLPRSVASTSCVASPKPPGKLHGRVQAEGPVDPGGEEAHAIWAYRPANVEDLAVASDAVVEAQVVDVKRGGGLVRGDGTAQLPTQQLVLRTCSVVRGTRTPQTFSMEKVGTPLFHIDGDPNYKRGERYILFLRATRHGRNVSWNLVSPDGRIFVRSNRRVMAIIPGAVAGQVSDQRADVVERYVAKVRAAASPVHAKKKAPDGNAGSGKKSNPDPWAGAIKLVSENGQGGGNGPAKPIGSGGGSSGPAPLPVVPDSVPSGMSIFATQAESKLGNGDGGLSVQWDWKPDVAGWEYCVANGSGCSYVLGYSTLSVVYVHNLHLWYNENWQVCIKAHYKNGHTSGFVCSDPTTTGDAPANGGGGGTTGGGVPPAVAPGGNGTTPGGGGTPGSTTPPPSTGNGTQPPVVGTAPKVTGLHITGLTPATSASSSNGHLDAAWDTTGGVDRWEYCWANGSGCSYVAGATRTAEAHTISVPIWLDETWSVCVHAITQGKRAGDWECASKASGSQPGDAGTATPPPSGGTVNVEANNVKLPKGMLAPDFPRNVRVVDLASSSTSWLTDGWGTVAWDRPSTVATPTSGWYQFCFGNGIACSKPYALKTNEYDATQTRLSMDRNQTWYGCVRGYSAGATLTAVSNWHCATKNTGDGGTPASSSDCESSRAESLVADLGVRVWSVNCHWFRQTGVQHRIFYDVGDPELLKLSLDAAKEWQDKTVLRLPRATSAANADVVVSMEYHEGDWLGFASNCVGCAQAQIHLNSYYWKGPGKASQGMTPQDWKGVQCQELGHVWGLNHFQGDCMGNGYYVVHTNDIKSGSAEAVNRLYRQFG